jgi:thimet oligopeptidase
MVTMKLSTLAAALAVLSVAACKLPAKGSTNAPGPHQAVPPPYVPPPKPAPEAQFLAGCRQPIALAKENIAALLAVSGVRTLDNTLVPFNDAWKNLNNAAEWARLNTEVHPDAKIREAAHTCDVDVSTFAAVMALDLRVYTAIKLVDVNNADAVTKRFVATTLRDFRHAGVELDDTGRSRIKQIDEEIAKLGQQFTQNLNDDVRRIEIKDPAKLAGLPADWIAAHKPDATGAIKVSADGSDLYAFMTYADDDELRKQLYVASRSRGDAKNEAVLQQVLVLRAEKALLLGHKDWADYESDDKMVRGGKAAADFIERVNKLVSRRAKKDYDELLAQLRKTTKTATEVTEWQRAYLENQVKREKYSVDATEVRKYFAFAPTLAGLLELTSSIYDIKLVPVASDPRVWHADVKVFDVMRNPKMERDGFTPSRGEDKLGRIFLDLHPRAGKTRRTATFPMVDGIKGVQLPDVALVGNFADPRKGPALLEHSDVVTLFHELGHALHHVFGGQVTWVRQSGASTEVDFYEAPSQAFEEWAWNAEVLARFAKHSETGAPIPAELVEKMRRADRFGKGAWAAQQLIYAALSLRMHQDAPGKLDQLALVKQLQKKYSPFAHVEGTKLHTSFSHLISYSSMYYTYLWSRVIARDLLTPFEKKGLLATDITASYRDKVLAAGGTKDAVDIVKDFLGRPYNYKAFEKYLSE